MLVTEYILPFGHFDPIKSLYVAGGNESTAMSGIVGLACHLPWFSDRRNFYLTYMSTVTQLCKQAIENQLTLPQESNFGPRVSHSCRAPASLSRMDPVIRDGCPIDHMAVNWIRHYLPNLWSVSLIDHNIQMWHLWHYHRDLPSFN